MANGYIRQALSNIQPGLEIDAEDFNDEFNALQNAFDNTAGHDHSGSATGTGAKISLVNSITGTLGLTHGGLGVNGATTAVTLVGLTVNGATQINSTLDVTGASTLAAVTCTTLAAGGNATVGGTLGVTSNITTTGTISGGVLLDTANRPFSLSNLPTILNTVPSNQTATTTIGDGLTTGVMLGMGVTFTPTKSTQLAIHITATMKTAAALDGGSAALRIGTGSAPANGDALTGTAIGEGSQFLGAANNDSAVPFTATVVKGGGFFSIGTAYWFDLGFGSQGGAAFTIYNVTVSIHEI